MSGYRFTFAALQNTYAILIEYVCKDGHRIKCREIEIDWQTPFIWC